MSQFPAIPHRCLCGGPLFSQDLLQLERVLSDSAWGLAMPFYPFGPGLLAVAASERLLLLLSGFTAQSLQYCHWGCPVVLGGPLETASTLRPTGSCAAPPGLVVLRREGRV